MELSACTCRFKGKPFKLHMSFYLCGFAAFSFCYLCEFGARDSVAALDRRRARRCINNTIGQGDEEEKEKGDGHSIYSSLHEASKAVKGCVRIVTAIMMECIIKAAYSDLKVDHQKANIIVTIIN